MPKCKECGYDTGFLDLKAGVCSACRKKTNPDCCGCRDSFPIAELKEGYCGKCFSKEKAKRNEDRADRQFDEAAKNVLLTTEAASALNVTSRLGIVHSDFCEGADVISEAFASVRDVIGGRSKIYERMIGNGRNMVLTELQQAAARLGANAVVGVSVTIADLAGGGKSMLLISGTGTAVLVGE